MTVCSCGLVSGEGMKARWISRSADDRMDCAVVKWSVVVVIRG